MFYQGSCHCGNVKFTVEGELSEVMACNCSICQRKGALMWFLPSSQVTVQSPKLPLKSYEFNKHAIAHKFCPTCGIHSIAEGADSAGNKITCINIRSLEDFDIDSVPIKHYDGRAA